MLGFYVFGGQLAAMDQHSDLWYLFEYCQNMDGKQINAISNFDWAQINRVKARYSSRFVWILLDKLEGSLEKVRGVKTVLLEPQIEKSVAKWETGNQRKTNYYEWDHKEMHSWKKQKQ